jgi:hypothetical protein
MKNPDAARRQVSFTNILPLLQLLNGDIRRRFAPDPQLVE